MHLIHSQDLPCEYINKLECLFPRLSRISIPRSNDIYSSISAHPDIFLFLFDDKKFIHSKSLPYEILKRIKEKGVHLIESLLTPSGQYPKTVSLNAVRVGEFIFHNLRFTDPEIINEAHKKGLKLVHINQGYTRCSVIPINQKAVITSDIGFAKKAREVGLDAELIIPGHIILQGELFGFIGGASGVTPDGRIIFLGDITEHPDFQKIDLFLKRHGTKYSYLPDVPLLDAGCLFFIE